MFEVPPALLSGLVVAVLVLYYMILAMARSRVASTSLMISLGALPLYTLVGALPLLSAEQEGGFATYLELELFDVKSDGTYAIAIVSYSVFLFLVLGVVVMAPTARWRELERRNLPTWATIWFHFNHGACLAAIAILEAVQLATVRSIAVDGSAYGLIVENSASGRAYTYSAIGATYLIALGAVGLAASGKKNGRAAKAIAYFVLAVGQVSLSLTSGQRRYVLIALVALVCGLVSVPSPARRVAYYARISILVLVGLLGLGAIGLLRGQQPSADPASTALTPGKVLESILQTPEIYSAHMSLYGVLQTSSDLPFVVPFLEGSYVPYVSVVGAASYSQGFTIHPVAAWWFTVGALAPLAAALMIAAAMLMFRRIAVARPSYWSRGYLAAAAVLPAAGIPAILLRGDSSSWRGLLLELLVIPGSLMQICFMLSPDDTWRSSSSRIRRRVTQRAAGSSVVGTLSAGDRSVSDAAYGGKSGHGHVVRRGSERQRRSTPGEH